MEQNENIITIRKKDIRLADQAFAEFMKITEDCLNDKAKRDNSLFKNCGGTVLEEVALNALREVSPITPFRPEEIILVSGARFPDIQAEHYYGVEVKSTKNDSWVSTGSSIVENTRIEDVENIYLLFGKLGGQFAEFRCRPYQDCMSNIAVTHSPRYTIDMNIADGKNEESIFKKIGVDYDTFRLLTEKEKVCLVRDYYKKHLKKGKEMPWWIGSDDSNISSPMVIRVLNDLSIQEKQAIVARLFILFPEVFGNSSTKYKQASLWLCSRHSIICPNIRDFFTAGGKVTKVGKVLFPKEKPQILKRLYLCRDIINDLLDNPDDSLIEDIADIWNFKGGEKSFRKHWIGLMKNVFKKTPDLKEIDFSEMFKASGLNE